MPDQKKFISRFLKEDKDYHNPVIFWVLIILMFVILAGSVRMLGESRDLTSNIPTMTPQSSREPRFYTISYKSGVFSPTNLRIRAGDTVRFKNESFFSIRVLSDVQAAGQIPIFDSVGDIPQGSYFSYTFAEKGIFGYHNDKNPEEQGMIIVR
jgi:plastocyanin